MYWYPSEKKRCNACTICHYLVSYKTCRHRCTFCHHSDKTSRFVTIVTKLAGVTKRAATVLAPFLHCGDTEVQDHVTRWQDRFKGWAEKRINSQTLDKVNVNLVRENVRRYYRLLCSPTAQWCSWLVMFEWFLSQLKTRPLKEQLEICLHCWNVLQDCCCVSMFKLIVSNG